MFQPHRHEHQHQQQVTFELLIKKQSNNYETTSYSFLQGG